MICIKIASLANIKADSLTKYKTILMQVSRFVVYLLFLNTETIYIEFQK